MKNFCITCRVYYEDTDAGGIVYHANYLKFMERARTDWLRNKGIEQQAFLEQNIAFVVIDMHVKFSKSAKLDDVLWVYCEPLKIGKASLLIHQKIYNNDQQTLVSADVKIACVNTRSNIPCKIPESILREIRSDS